MITSRDTRIINRLLKISEELENGMRCKHVAALYEGKRLISLAHNVPRSHPFEYRYSKCQNHLWLHAEKNCLVQAKWRDLSGCTMYVARMDLSGEPNLSKPCSSCCAALVAVKIKRVVYSIKNGIREDYLT